jgi:signal transduction histidine kinase/CheY-like chemotaxis protein
MSVRASEDDHRTPLPAEEQPAGPRDRNAERPLAFLGEIARSMSASLELDTVLQRIAGGARDLCRSDAASVFLRDGDADVMLPRFRLGGFGPVYQDLRIAPGRGIGGHVLLTGRPIRTDRYLDDPRVSAEFHSVGRETGTVALMVVPITIAGRVEGLLYLSNRSPRAFTDEDEWICLMLAEQAAIAIQNARLYAGERAARAEAETLAAVSRAINESLDLDTVLQGMTDSACSLLRADVAVVFGIDPASGGMALRAAGGALAATLDANVVVPRGTGIVWLAAERREAIVTSDVLDDARFTLAPEMRERIERARHRAALAVPLSVRGQLIGALFVGALPGRVFGPDEVRLATALAHHAAVAMANAELYRQAQASNRAKDEFLAMLAHELRNPLSAILAAVGVLTRLGPRDERLVGARSVIRRQTAHLARIVDDLLDVARVTTGKITLAPEPVDLAANAARCLATLRASTPLDAYTVDVRTDTVWVCADPTRLDQVVLNLLTNAMKFTPAGGTIRVRVGPEGDEAVLRVEDTGVGISPELLPRVFDLFTQGERGLDRRHGGLGIGLTLVRRLVEMHGGRVEAHSPGGRGSEFIVRLPRIASPVELPGSLATRDRAETRVRRRVLLVEDNADAREMVRAALELAGHEVHEAADGEAGLAAARALAPDIAIVDVGLPGLDGYEIARRLRLEQPGVRLIALTGYGRVQDRERALMAGFDEHLVKPVDPGDLADRIAAA